MANDGHHDHHRELSGHDARSRRALGLALVANAGFLVVEIIGGFAFSSLALLADAAHLGADVAALTLALFAQRLMTRPATGRRTYGMRRAEALGAQASAVLLIVTSIWIVVEAAHRLDAPDQVEGVGLTVVATIGLLVNLGGARLLAPFRGTNLNLRAAFVHLAADAAASIGAIAAGIAVVAFDATWLDPAVSFLIAGLVVLSAVNLLRDSTNVLLEGAPRGLDPRIVEDALASEPGVDAVHHLHLWELASDLPALSAHVVLEGEFTLHDAQARGDELRAMLEERFGIEHATLELECHECDDPDHESSARPGSSGSEVAGRGRHESDAETEGEHDLHSREPMN